MQVIFLPIFFWNPKFIRITKLLEISKVDMLGPLLKQPIISSYSRH